MNNKYNIRLSKRYASSLVGSMLGGGFNDNEITDGLNNVKTILDNSNDLYMAMLNPVISAQDKISIVDTVFEKDCNTIVRNFLKILIEKNRFNLIYSIIDELIKLIDKIKNVVKIDVTSAITLEADKKDKIKDKLTQKLKKLAEVNYNVDDKIIAGLIFKTEDNVLDTSLMRKLEDLKQELI